MSLPFGRMDRRRARSRTSDVHPAPCPPAHHYSAAAAWSTRPASGIRKNRNLAFRPHAAPRHETALVGAIEDGRGTEQKLARQGRLEAIDAPGAHRRTKMMQPAGCRPSSRQGVPVFSSLRMEHRRTRVTHGGNCQSRPGQRPWQLSLQLDAARDTAHFPESVILLHRFGRDVARALSNEMEAFR